MDMSRSAMVNTASSASSKQKSGKAKKEMDKLVLCEYSKFSIKLNSLLPIQLFDIFEYLFKCNIYEGGTVSVRKCGCPQCCC